MYEKLTKCPNLTWFLSEKLSQCPNFFIIFARKINKIPQFYLTFARKMPEFYIKIARKTFFSRILGGHMPPTPACPPSFTPVWVSYFMKMGLVYFSWNHNERKERTNQITDKQTHVIIISPGGVINCISLTRIPFRNSTPAWWVFTTLTQRNHLMKTTRRQKRLRNDL